jgi:hypothetical protein
LRLLLASIEHARRVIVVDDASDDVEAIETVARPDLFRARLRPRSSSMGSTP